MFCCVGWNTRELSSLSRWSSVNGRKLNPIWEGLSVNKTRGPWWRCRQTLEVRMRCDAMPCHAMPTKMNLASELVSLYSLIWDFLGILRQLQIFKNMDKITHILEYTATVYDSDWNGIRKSAFRPRIDRACSSYIYILVKRKKCKCLDFAPSSQLSRCLNGPSYKKLAMDARSCHSFTKVVSIAEQKASSEQRKMTQLLQVVCYGAKDMLELNTNCIDPIDIFTWHHSLGFSRFQLHEDQCSRSKSSMLFKHDLALQNILYLSQNNSPKRKPKLKSPQYNLPATRTHKK